MSRFGVIEVSKTSSWFKNRKGVKITPYMGEICTYLGQLLPYDKCFEMVQKLLGTEVSGSTIFRLTNQNGKEAESFIEDLDWSLNKGEATVAQSNSKDNSSCEYTYAGMDGTMIQTKEGWKEAKLGRSFKANDIDNESDRRSKINKSNYVALLGCKDDFVPRMNKLLEQTVKDKSKLIFINDGATWIDLLIRTQYPEAISIIDYYHVCEKLGDFSKECISPKNRSKWFEETKDQLLNQGGKSILEKLLEMEVKTKRQQEAKNKIVTYFENHCHKMDYPDYDKKGFYIGSGFIESAHRNVLHSRMKRSGQRWSIQGANNMINLRTLQESGKWNDLINELFRAA